MIVPGPRLWWAGAAAVVVAVVLASGTGLGWGPAVLYTSAGLLALALVDALGAGSPRAVSIDRDFPPAVVLHSHGSLAWSLARRGRTTRWVAVADSLAPSLNCERRFTTRLGPNSTVRVEHPLNPTRRGRFEEDALTVRVYGPLRLAGRQTTRSDPFVLRVLPEFRSRREIEIRMRRARLLDVGSLSVSAHGGGTQFDHLREYGVDDQYRNIDWAATARRGHPIVRAYRAEEHRTMVVVLDNGRLMAARVDGATRLEHAMDAAMALDTVASRLGDLTALQTFDLDVHPMVPAGRGSAHMGRFTESLYTLEPVLSESDYQLMAEHLAARLSRQTLIVVLTDLVDPVVEATMARAVATLAVRNRVVVGAVADPQVVEWALSVPTDAEEAHLTAAAVAGIGSRERAARRLREVGATVVDAPAGKLAARLVDNYLETKALGRW